MIVDPMRHLTDILALGGMVFFSWLFAWTIFKLSGGIPVRQQREAEPAAVAIPARANDNRAMASGGPDRMVA